MNKYYTPEIKEFHVGFECEILGYNPKKRLDKNFKKEWDKIIYSLEDFIYLEEKNILSNFRVKYLDKEDIESLGFKNISGNWYYDDKTYQIIGDYKSLEISKGEHEFRKILFKGIIKNKSELKKLMKQLNIN